MPIYKVSPEEFFGGQSVIMFGSSLSPEAKAKMSELQAKRRQQELAVTNLTERFDEALVYAHQLHRAQRRKGTTIPYVAHLLAVAALALEAGADEDQAIAALLHDAAEDQGGLPTLEEIRRRFGDRVAQIVDHCTDTHDEPKPAWRERKEAYVASLAHKPADSLLVSLADKTHNASAILADLAVHGASLWDRFSGGKDGTLWYYDALARAFRAHLPGPGAERLAGIVEDMHNRQE